MRTSIFLAIAVSTLSVGCGSDLSSNTRLAGAEEPRIFEDETCYDAEAFICEIEQEITRLTNERRPVNAPVAHHGRLSYVARDWSLKQMNSGGIGHGGFPNSRYAVYRARFGSEDPVFMSGENVAYSSASPDSAESVARVFVNMWWNSSGHRQNMLGNHKLLGSGVARRGNVYYATQIFGRQAN